MKKKQNLQISDEIVTNINTEVRKLPLLKKIRAYLSLYRPVRYKDFIKYQELVARILEALHDTDLQHFTIETDIINMIRKLTMNKIDESDKGGNNFYG